MQKPKALIFDWDGTLVDTSTAIATALQPVLDFYHVGNWDMVRKTHWDPAESLKGNFKNMFGANAVDAYQQYLKLYLQHSLPLVKVAAGAVSLIRTLNKIGILAFVASNKEKMLLQKEMPMCFSGVRFDGALANGDAARNKPFPDPIFKCLEGVPFKINAQNVFMVGDALPDYLAATAAGVRPMLIENHRLNEIKADLTDVVFKDFAALEQMILNAD